MFQAPCDTLTTLSQASPHMLFLNPVSIHQSKWDYTNTLT